MTQALGQDKTTDHFALQTLPSSVSWHKHTQYRMMMNLSKADDDEGTANEMKHSEARVEENNHAGVKVEGVMLSVDIC